MPNIAPWRRPRSSVAWTSIGGFSAGSSQRKTEQLAQTSSPPQKCAWRALKPVLEFASVERRYFDRSLAVKLVGSQACLNFIDHNCGLAAQQV